MPTDTTTLLPCPFCGCPARMLTITGYDHSCFRVECSAEVNCPTYPKTLPLYNASDAAEAWNTRHEQLNLYLNDPDY